MFSAFKAVKGALFGGEEEEEEEDKTVRCPPLVNEEKEMEGVITSISNDYGMIDGEIYFTMDVLDGNIRKQEGTKVHVVAERQHAFGGWKATKITPVNKLSDSWNAFEEAAENSEPAISYQTKIGIVTAINRESGTIDNTIRFSLSDTKDEFAPFVGDVVKSVIETDASTNTMTAQNVEPVRVKEFEGVVTLIGQGSGTIDDNIHYTLGACRPGTYMRKGDAVVGCAVESSRGKNAWRAVWVEKDKAKAVNAEKILGR